MAITNEEQDYAAELEAIRLEEAEIAAAEEAYMAEEELRMDQSEAIVSSINREPLEYTRPQEQSNLQANSFFSTSSAATAGNLNPQLSRTRIATQEAPDKFTLAENAAANGIDVTTGLPSSVRVSASLLSFDPNAQQSAIESLVRDGLGPDFPAHETVLARDNASGMTAFLRKEEDGSFRWTLVNPPGLDVGDIAEFGGELPTIGLEIGGSLVGGVAGAPLGGVGTAVGATTGASIAAAASVPLRTELAKMAGIPDPIIDTIDIKDEAKWMALMAGGGELAGHSIVGSFSAVRNFFGRPLDIKDLPAIKVKIKENQAKLRAGEKAGDVEFNPTLGQLTGDTDLQIAEASIKNTATGKVARELKAAEINNVKAETQAMRNMATQEVRTVGDAGFESVEAVSEEVQDRLVRDQLDSPAAARETALEDVASFDEAYDVAANRQVFEDAQTNSAAALVAMRNSEKAAWDLHRKTIEWDPIARTSGIGLDNSGNTPIREFMSQLRGDADGALMSSLAQTNEATLKSAGFGPDEVASIMRGGNPTGLAGEVLDARHLHTTLSHLKRTRAQVSNGINPNNFEVNDLDGLIRAIEGQFDGGTFIRVKSRNPVNPEKAMQIRDSWALANDTTILKNATFDSKAMRSMLETKPKVVDGKVKYPFDLTPAFIERRLYAKGDARFLSEAMESVGHDPAIKAGMAQEFMKLVRKNTIRDGKVQQGLYNDMMADYADHMDLLLTPAQQARITNLGSMGRVIDNMGVATEQLARKLTKQYGRVVADPTSPFNIAEEILGGRMGAKRVTNLMNDLRKLPDSRLAQQVEEKVMERIFKTVTKGDGKAVDFTSLDALIINNMDTLKAVGGSKYVANLAKVRDSISILAEKRFAKAARETPQTFFERSTRLLFGPLSRAQRTISAVSRSARNSRAGTVSKLLRDPNKLDQFVKLTRITPRDPRFWVGAQLIGDDVLDMFIQMAPEEWQQFSTGELQDRRDQEEFGRRQGLIL